MAGEASRTVTRDRVRTTTPCLRDGLDRHGTGHDGTSPADRCAVSRRRGEGTGSVGPHVGGAVAGGRAMVGASRQWCVGTDPGRVVRRQGDIGNRAATALGSTSKSTVVGRRSVRLMGWNNPPMLWQELECRLTWNSTESGDRDNDSDSAQRTASRIDRLRAVDSPAPEGGGNVAGKGRTPYAELHCHSNFSFLDGASRPEELVAEAAGLGLDAVALTDHDGMYGAVRFAEEAAEVGMRTVFGTELSLGLD